MQNHIDSDENYFIEQELIERISSNSSRFDSKSKTLILKNIEHYRNLVNKLEEIISSLGIELKLKDREIKKLLVQLI